MSAEGRELARIDNDKSEHVSIGTWIARSHPCFNIEESQWSIHIIIRKPFKAKSGHIEVIGLSMSISKHEFSSFRMSWRWIMARKLQQMRIEVNSYTSKNRKKL